MPLDNNNSASMIVATVRMKSLATYSQSRPHQTPDLEKETPADKDMRTWREKAHIDKATGQVFIPPMAFKHCISDAASFLGIKIPGRNRSTYAKHFLAGILCVSPLLLPVKKEEMHSEDVFVDANGRKNSGSRVWRRFPVFDDWEGSFEFNVLDRTITRDVFERVLIEAGQFIGIGRFRPRNGGYYGRFSVIDVKWDDSSSS